MASVTVGDLLRQIEEFHQGLADLYDGLVETCTSERTRMLAKYMARREERLVAAITRYEDDVRNNSTLAYWFKVAPLLPEKLQLKDAALPPEIDTDDLSNFAVDLDEALRGFVKDISDSATSLRVRELFADLMAQEEREQRQTSRATLEVEREL
jgi:hypothetical protein